MYIDMELILCIKMHMYVPSQIWAKSEQYTWRDTAFQSLLYKSTLVRVREDATITARSIQYFLLAFGTQKMVTVSLETETMQPIRNIKHWL